MQLILENLKEEMFAQREDITHILLKNVHEIPSECFRECIHLKQVLIIGAIEDINYDAFAGCSSLETVVLAGGDSRSISIWWGAFRDCVSLRYFNFFDRLETISSYVFENCGKLKNIHLGSNLRRLSKSAFCGCDLSQISIDNNRNYLVKEGFLLEKKKDGKKAICRAMMYLGSDKTAKIPREVSCISDFCFRNSEINSIIIPPNTLTLEDIDCPDDKISITAVEDLGDGRMYPEPEDIGSYLADIFFHCRHLVSFSVQKGNSAFSVRKGTLYSKDKKKLYRVPLTLEGRFEVPAGTVEIDHFAFSGCSAISEIVIPASVERLGYAVCKACKDLKVTLEDGNPFFMKKNGIIYQIDDSKKKVLLTDKDITELKLDSDVTCIDPYAFSNCTGLVSADLSSLDRLIYLGDHAFSGCSSLKEVILPANLGDVPPAAFENCTALQKVTFPENVKGIGERILAGCSQDITIHIDRANILVSDYFYLGSNCRVTYELGSKYCNNRYNDLFTYQAVAGYIAEGHDTLQSDEIGALYSTHKTLQCRALVKAPSVMDSFSVSGVDLIMTYAFKWCYELPYLYIPDEVKYIGEYAFWGCKKLKVIRIPEHVEILESDDDDYEGEKTELYEVTDENVDVITAYCRSLEWIIIGDRPVKVGRSIRGDFDDE